MRIIKEYDDVKTKQIQIKSVKYIGDFVIRIFFSDDFSTLVDFKPFLENSLHPTIRNYLNENKFKNYKIIDGNLNWNDYDLIFPIEDLYKGKI